MFVLLSCKQVTEVAENYSFDKNEAIKPNASFSLNEKDFEYLPSSTTNQIIKHQYYTLSYNEKYEQAEWVAYLLKKEYLKSKNFKRPYFIQDPEVSTNSADWRNYKNSGFDKGHLCPAGDMNFDAKAFDDTFYTSNISPQKREFNGGIWNRLEQKTRYWASQFGDLYVVTGGVFKGATKTIGSENVLVPNSFYKILFHSFNGKYKMIAFVIPNEKSDKPLYDYVVSVDDLEKITGIDFFYKMDDKIENDLEKSANYELWIKM